VESIPEKTVGEDHGFVAAWAAFQCPGSTSTRRRLGCVSIRHSPLGHLTPNEFAEQRQATRTDEAVAFSG
jgi:hypothetical protein